MTKFSGKGVNSRPYWPGGGVSRREGQVQGGHPQGDRPGPKGGTWPGRTPELNVPPTPAHAGLPGPASLYIDLSPSSWAGYRYYPSPAPTQSHTHPGTPPYSPPSTARCGTLGAVTYDRSGHPVGEPRGIRTQPNSGSQTGLLRLRLIARPFDWVYDCFDHVLLNLGPVLLNYEVFY